MDVQIGQGAGYVYMHQGCCEHLLELKDVRTVQAADPKLASAFPVILFQVSLPTIVRMVMLSQILFVQMAFCVSCTVCSPCPVRYQSGWYGKAKLRCDLQLMCCLKFPCLRLQERKVRRLCNLCKSTASVWVTHDDKYAPENPCFWCEDCYHQMHYDTSNTLLYSDYIALPYQWEMGMVKSIYNDNEKKTEEAV